MYFEAQILSRSFFFTVSAKVLGKVVVVGSGQNKNLLRECGHWTKVRLRRDKVRHHGEGCFYSVCQCLIGKYELEHSVGLLQTLIITFLKPTLCCSVHHKISPWARLSSSCHKKFTFLSTTFTFFLPIITARKLCSDSKWTVESIAKMF